jgi:hypothetical protein
MYGRNYHENVDLAFEKLNLQRMTKSATNVERTVANVNGTVDGAIEKPKH